MNPSSRIIQASAVALAVTFAGHAQSETSDSARIKELEKKLERSLELIEQLSSKISKIEQATANARDAQAVQQAAKIGAIEKHVSEISSTVARRSTDEGLPVHGFADIALATSGEGNATFRGRKGATVGALDLYLTPRFSDHVTTLIELIFENDDGHIEAEIERMQIGYGFSDAATVWAGRFHTPFGYWNTAFHHGAQIQTSIFRPHFLEFEDKGGILPTHTVGGWLTGDVPTTGGKVGYDIFAGNAPQISNTATGTALATSHRTGFSSITNAGTYAGSGKLNAMQAGSTTHRWSAGFNAWFEPRAVDGLRIGLHGLRADVIDNTANVNRTLLNMFGGYFAYHGEPWEVLGEYYRFRNQDRSGGTGTHGSWAGYAQIGYNVGRWTPFARAERTKIDQTDNYFGVLSSGRSYQRVAAGLRFDVDPKAALKIEYLGTRKEDLGPGVTDKYPEFRLQYSIRF